MLRLSKYLSVLLISISLVFSAYPQNQSTRSAAKPKITTPVPDLTKQPTLYVVGYAHLDTEWRWEYPQVIQEYLSKTLRSNFALMDKYPNYIFNFTGANRYRLMKEYYPADFEKLKKYVAAGRWFPAGSSMEEGDVNSPNAESIFRQILYGNDFFRREFGVASEEYMLPDCFGFPASLPSILIHSGMKGFSTQKLSAAWQPAPHVGGPDSPEKTPEGIPFNVGLWEGTDGKAIIAALNPLTYDSPVIYDLSKNPPPPPAPDPSLTPEQNRRRTRGEEDWVKRIQINGDLTGVKADYHYVGTGDIGGSPDEISVRRMEAITTGGQFILPGQEPVPMGNGPIHVVWSKADQMFLDILKCCNTDRLPRFKGDLELINHSAGSITSEAYQKRWIRKNELLADAAEKASIMSAWLGGTPYPMERLNNAWTLVMGGQFHDILPGTATPKSFEFAWNDDILAMNQFAGVLSSATENVATAMNTKTAGVPVVVYNPLNIQREDIVEANVLFPNGTPKAVRVFGPDGKEVAAQLAGDSAKVIFPAKVPSVGYVVYDVRPADSGSSAASELKVSESSLENARYKVTLDQNGDIAGIFDKKLNRQLLSSPMHLAISKDNPKRWPAWNMDFEDEQRAPRTIVSGPAKVRIVENGPARVAVSIERQAENSTFVQTVRLSAGDSGNRVEFNNAIDWAGKEGNLKAVFPLSAKNPMATYNWDVGTVQRPNETDRQFEVPSHQWIDLTDKDGSFGATVLTDYKNGSDKPDDGTLRLTLLRTPGTRGGYQDQGTQDIGHHDILFGLSSHDGDWRKGETDWQGYRLNDPLVGFQTSKHAGTLGNSFSLMKIGSSRVRVLALKKAEHSDELILRIVEIDGKPIQNVHISFAAPIADAREVNAQEQPLSAATVTKGEIITSLGGYEPRTFALKLGPAPAKVEAPTSQPVALPYDISVASAQGQPSGGCFDCFLDKPTATQGKALPAEMLPSSIDYAGIRFKLADSGQLNAVTAQGQIIPLPAGTFNRIYLLAAAANGDHKAIFHAGDKPVELNIEEWTGFIGQWDDRIWKRQQEPIPPRPGSPAAAPGTPVRVRTDDYAEMIGLKPGFTKRADVGWFSSHRHDVNGANEAYAYSYLFAYAIDLPAGATTLTLPLNDSIRVLAVTAAHTNDPVRPVQPLYDTLQR